MKVQSIPTEVEETVDVVAEPVVEEQQEPNLLLLSSYKRYFLNKSSACMRRIQKLKLSDKEITDKLETNEGRKLIGYNYLVSEIDVDAYNAAIDELKAEGKL
tara:strand:+ start:123 stop:428 length:306 start_codon:yes stop_codon:yes gene_type:complete